MGFIKHCAFAIFAWGSVAITCTFGGEPVTVIPKEKNPERHTAFLEDIKKMHGTINLVFVGDSITDNWRAPRMQTVWKKYFEIHKALNLGISGDCTQHLLWRLQNGELDGYEARLFVLMIGTNGGQPAPDVAAGIKAILTEIKTKQPQAKILLMGIFPRGEKPDDPFRLKNAAVNKLIVKFADDQTVYYLDIGDKFMEPDKTLSFEMMPDQFRLHPSLKGYQIWADAIDEIVNALLKETDAAQAGPGPYKKLATLAAQIKTGTGLGQVLKTLATKKDSKDAEEAAEAKMMFEALHSSGQESLDRTLSSKEKKPLSALTRLEKLATQFAGDEIGTQAKQAAELLKKDPKIAKEIEAELAFKKIQAFEEMLKPVKGVKDLKDSAYKKLNAQAFETIVGGCQQLLQRYPGTIAAQKATDLMSDYK